MLMADTHSGKPKAAARKSVNTIEANQTADFEDNDQRQQTL